MNKKKLILGAVVLTAVFAVGRYTAPVKIEREEKTIDVTNKNNKKSEDVSKDKKVTTVTKDVTKPDGTKEHTVTQVVDNKTIKSKDSSNSETTIKETDKKEVIEKESSRLSLSLLAGTKFSFSSPEPLYYGLMVQKDLLGPFHLGAFGLTNGLVGMGIGVSF